MSAHRSIAVRFGFVVLWLAFGNTVYAQKEPLQQKLAFLVGVNHYDRSALRSLRYAERDIAELANVLKEQHFEVMLLTTTLGKNNPGVAPTAANMRARLNSLLSQLKKNDLILVGLAGHGIQPPESRDCYFCPADADPTIKRGKPNTLSDPDSLYSLRDLLRTLESSSAGHKLLLFDAFGSDSDGSPHPANGEALHGIPAGGFDALELPKHTQVILKYSQRELPTQGKSIGGGHGVLFHHVAQGLWGAAAEGSGNVTWGSLRSYVNQNIQTRDGTSRESEEISSTTEGSFVLGRAIIRPSEDLDREVPDPHPEYHNVSVFYATDRHASGQMKPTGQEPIPFWPHFIDFFLLNLQWIIGLSAGGVMLVLFWRRRRTTLVVLNATVVGLTTLWMALALLYAYQQSAKLGVIVDSGLTGNRGEMSYGLCNVSVPLNHKAGIIEPRFSVFLIKLERENPSKHVAYLGKTPLEWESFLKELRAKLAKSESKECFVFIHGYNNTFEDAAKRTAQFWYDLSFPGPPILYSWPSQGTALQYSVDYEEATWTQPHFTSFLRALLSESTATRVHLIAHSMGTRILAGALAELGEHGELDNVTCAISQVVLAAPDIDADVFRRDLAPKFAKKRAQITLYASANDQALNASRSSLVHGYRRAGDTKDGIVVVDGIDTVEASLLDTSFETHSYFAASPTVVSDIRNLVVDGLSPARRGLREAFEGSKRYWLIPKPTDK